MRIAVIGYGKMGKTIEKIALERGHEIALIVDADNSKELLNPAYDFDVAIEFSTPNTAADNIINCLKRNVPVISGTTGWLDKLPEIESVVKSQSGTFFLCQQLQPWS